MGFSESTGTTGLRGVMLINPKYRSIYELQRVTQMGIQLRLYPELNAEGNPLPIRFGKRLEDVGNWIDGGHYGISYLGGGSPDKEKVTMLVSIRGDEKVNDPAQRRGLRVWQQILNTLYYRIQDGTAPQHWGRWTAETRDAVFGTKQKSKAKPMAFARGLMTWCMTQKGPLRTVSPNKPKLNCVFLFPQRAQDALVELVMSEKPGVENLNTDQWNKVFENNNKIVDLETGCLINFGKPGQANPQAHQQPSQAAGQVNFSGAAMGTEQDDDKFKVAANIIETPPCKVPLDVAQKFCQDVPLADVLNVYENERDLVSALEVGFPDDLLIESFIDFPDYLSARLKAKREQTLSQAHQPGPAAATPPAMGGVPPTYAAPAATPPAPQATPPAPQADPAAASPPSAVNFGGAEGPSVAEAAAAAEPQANDATAGFTAPVAATPDGGSTGQPTGVAPQSVDDTMQQLEQAAAEAKAAGEAQKPAEG